MGRFGFFTLSNMNNSSGPSGSLQGSRVGNRAIRLSPGCSCWVLPQSCTILQHSALCTTPQYLGLRHLSHSPHTPPLLEGFHQILRLPRHRGLHQLLPPSAGAHVPPLPASARGSP